MDEMHGRPSDPGTDRIERIAEPLRAPERLSVGFEERLLSRVRAEAIEQAMPKKELPRSWWTRPRTLHRAPIVSLALAAGFAAVVALSTLAYVRSGPLSTIFVSTTDTVHVMRFVYHDTAATHIAVVGDFNGWGESEIPLRMNEAGVWTATVAIPAGAHEYAFVVDRQHWVADPSALSARDEFGTPTSRVRIGAADFTATE
jgi:hypothetical protein